MKIAYIIVLLLVGCGKEIVQPQVIPDGITITYRETSSGQGYWRVEKSIYAKISVNGDMINSWCPSEIGLYRNLMEGDVFVADVLVVDVGWNGIIDYKTRLNK